MRVLRIGLNKNEMFAIMTMHKRQTHIAINRSSLFFLSVRIPLDFPMHLQISILSFVCQWRYVTAIIYNLAITATNAIQTEHKRIRFSICLTLIFGAIQIACQIIHSVLGANTRMQIIFDFIFFFFFFGLFVSGASR